MRSRFGLLGAAIIVLLAAAAPAGAQELVQPAAHAIVRGGSFAPLQCSFLTVPAGAEEWEAFLSLDGGAHYDVRLTPHLNLSVDRYSWLVPNVDSTDARILIRTGDERRETILEIPQTFSIQRDPRAQIRPPSWIVREQAEAARPGDAPVIAWAEGDRAGTGRTFAGCAASNRSWSTTAASSQSSPSIDGTSQPLLTPFRASRNIPFRLPTPARGARPEAVVHLDILLACRRLNI